jgi:hypothetical protein
LALPIAIARRRVLLEFLTFLKVALNFDHGSLDLDQHVCAGESLVIWATTLNLWDGSVAQTRRAPIENQPKRNQHLRGRS